MVWGVAIVAVAMIVRGARQETTRIARLQQEARLASAEAAEAAARSAAAIASDCAAACRADVRDAVSHLDALAEMKRGLEVAGAGAPAQAIVEAGVEALGRAISEKHADALRAFASVDAAEEFVRARRADAPGPFLLRQ